MSTCPKTNNHPSYLSIAIAYRRRLVSFFQTGLRYDDLISEENELVQEALRRLEIAEPHEMYERAYRIRVAQQCSLTHSLLPKEKWVTPATVSHQRESSG